MEKLDINIGDKLTCPSWYFDKEDWGIVTGILDDENIIVEHEGKEEAYSSSYEFWEKLDS